MIYKNPQKILYSVLISAAVFFSIFLILIPSTDVLQRLYTIFSTYSITLVGFLITVLSILLIFKDAKIFKSFLKTEAFKNFIDVVKTVITVLLILFIISIFSLLLNNSMKIDLYNYLLFYFVMFWFIYSLFLLKRILKLLIKIFEGIHIELTGAEE